MFGLSETFLANYRYTYTMSTIELKNKLHAIIDTINDSDKLKAMLTLLNVSDSEGDWYDDLSDAQKQSIDRGLDDIKHGRVRSHKEVMDEMKKKYPQLY